MIINNDSTPLGAISEVKTFITNHVITKPEPGHPLESMKLAHNDVWALRQLVAEAEQRQQQLVDAAREIIRTELFFQDHPQKYAAQQALRAALAAIGSAA